MTFFFVKQRFLLLFHIVETEHRELVERCILTLCCDPTCDLNSAVCVCLQPLLCVSHLCFSHRHRLQPTVSWTTKQLESWRLRSSLWRAYCSAGNKVIQTPVTWNSAGVWVCLRVDGSLFSCTFEFLCAVHLNHFTELTGIKHLICNLLTYHVLTCTSYRDKSMYIDHESFNILNSMYFLRKCHVQNKHSKVHKNYVYEYLFL